MHVLQRVGCALPIVLGGLAGCLRDTSHACEAAGACAGDDAGAVDATSSDASANDGAGGPDAPPLSAIDVGRGVDGPLVVSGNNDARINTCAQLSIAAGAGASSIVIDPSTIVAANVGTDLGSFAADRRVIVWQTAGLAANAITIGDQAPFAVPANIGHHEVARVTTVTAGPLGNATVLTLAAPLDGSYTATAQVCRVPELTDLSVGSPTGMPTAQLRPPAWNGAVGGLLAFYASGTVTIGGAAGNGSVNASGRGMRAGVANNFSGAGEDCTDLIGDPFGGGGAHKGEGLVTSLFATGSGAAANTFGLGNAASGGGGGGCHNAGGGGGSNGGRGGRGGDQADPDALGGALGGAPLVIDPRTQLVMGGGGGAGEGDDNSAGDGGDGGGVVWLHAASVSCSAIRAAGNTGGASGASPRDGAGGGGAGGTILAEVRTLNACTFDAGGGAGGRSYIGANSYPSGPGGGGGGGRVYLRTDTRTIEPQVGVAGGAAGTVADGSGSHGATAGELGVTCDDCLAP